MTLKEKLDKLVAETDEKDLVVYQEAHQVGKFVFPEIKLSKEAIEFINELWGQ